MSTFTLDYIPEFDFKIIGISCHAKDYRLCWSLNNSLGTYFEFEHNAEKTHKRSKEILKSEHAVFSYVSLPDETKYQIITNRGTDALLFSPRHTHIDFFVIVDGYLNDNLTSFINDLKRENLILTAYEINLQAITDKESFLLIREYAPQEN